MLGTSESVCDLDFELNLASSGLNLIEAIRPLEKSGPSIDKAGSCVNSRPVFLACKVCEHPLRLEVGCNSRFSWVCPHCAARWQKRVKWRYYSGVLAMRVPKLVTLTLRHEKGRLATRLLRLWGLRKQLFEVLAFKGYEIRSWCGVIEAPNHIHLIVDMDYIPQWEMSAVWQSVTGDSFIVSIEKVNLAKDPRKVVSYLTKYLTKASTRPGLNMGLLEGFHLVGSWGLPPRERFRLSCPLCGFEHGFYVLDGEAFNATLGFCLDREAHPPPDWYLNVPLEGGGTALVRACRVIGTESSA